MYNMKDIIFDITDNCVKKSWIYFNKLYWIKIGFIEIITNQINCWYY